MNKQHMKYLFCIFIILGLAFPFCGIRSTYSLPNKATDFAYDEQTSDIWAKSNVTMPATQNLTIIPSNLSIVELASQLDPTRSVIDIVTGFEPTLRFNSNFNSTLIRNSYVGNCSLTDADNGLLLFLNASSEHNAAIAAYNLSFTNAVQISENDFISLAMSTSNTYNSSEAYIGVSLILRDPQGNRHYASIQISDQYYRDSFDLTEWFLGWSFGEDYPLHLMRYNSTSGPWFIQLPLSNSLASLNLSSAWLDGLLIGGEIYIKPPFNVEEITEVHARFHYVLVHEQQFMINQEMVNSTTMVFPFASSLRFSGIPGEKVNVIVKGSLKPTYDSEQQDNETIKVRETLFNLSETLDSGILIQQTVEISTPSKTVKKCTIALDNSTFVDLTDSLLDSDIVIHEFPEDTTLVKVHLALYRFNAWFFNFFGYEPDQINKKGIIEEYFSTNENTGIIKINSSETLLVNLAIRSGKLMLSEISINGNEKPLESLLVLNRERYWIISTAKPLENSSTLTVKYIISDESSHQSLTTPFSIYIDGYIFKILTPFHIESQERILIPLTIQMFVLETYTLRIEYDASMFEADRDEIMVYSSRYHYEYFMLKPLQIGQTTINLRIIDPITNESLFSSVFLVSIKSSFLTQLPIYILLSVAVFCLIYIFGRGNLRRLLSILRSRQT